MTVIDAIGEDSGEVPVALTMNDDVDFGEDTFVFRYGNLTVDGNGNALSGQDVTSSHAVTYVVVPEGVAHAVTFTREGDWLVLPTDLAFYQTKIFFVQ